MGVFVCNGRGLEERLDRFLLDCVTDGNVKPWSSLETLPIFLLVWRSDLDGYRATATAARGITVNAIATSLLRPYESVRRRAATMIAAGQCDTVPRGLVIAADGAGARWCATLARAIVAALDKLIDVRIPPSPARLTTALDLLLAFHECHARHNIGWADMTIMAALGTGATAEVLAIVDRTADRSDPYGATINAVAQRLSLPYTTVWRHVRKLEAAQYVVQHGGSYRLAPDWVRGGQVGAPRKAVVARAHHLLTRLVEREAAEARAEAEAEARKVA